MIEFLLGGDFFRQAVVLISEGVPGKRLGATMAWEGEKCCSNFEGYLVFLIKMLGMSCFWYDCDGGSLVLSGNSNISRVILCGLWCLACFLSMCDIIGMHVDVWCERCK